MCASVLPNSGALTEIALQTVSCDGLYRQAPMQCGYCSSCLLRRQAFAAAQIRDESGYVVNGRGCRDRSQRKYLRAILHQASQLSEMLGGANGKAPLSLRESWSRLSSQYLTLPDIVDRTADLEGMSAPEMKQRIITMYRRYAEEWSRVEDELTQELMPDPVAEVA